jgi:hypothetical protein
MEQRRQHEDPFLPAESVEKVLGVGSELFEVVCCEDCPASIAEG